MNTSVEAVVCLPPGSQVSARETLEQVRALFLDTEQRYSRFLAASELSQLNLAAGRPFLASPGLFEVVQAALDSTRLTDGIFDPTILPCLTAAGYDRSFELLEKMPVIPPRESLPFRSACKEIELDSNRRTIRLPPGSSLDLGGIAKGWTVDRAGRILARFTDFAVNAGGDLIVGGRQADRRSWTIGIVDPQNPQRGMVGLNLRSGAVCTSSSVKRSWQSGGVRLHHLIDPRTGRPADSGVISATVLAPSAALAETFSKAALILGSSAGLRLLNSRPDIQGWLVLNNGRCLQSAGLAKT